MQLTPNELMVTTELLLRVLVVVRTRDVNHSWYLSRTTLLTGFRPTFRTDLLLAVVRTAGAGPYSV